MKLQLPTVTLVCTDCIDLPRAIYVIEKCRQQIDFGSIKLLTDIETDYPYKVAIQKLSNLTMYSVFMLKEIHKYVKTKHMLIIQHDGYVLNANEWDNEWLNLDYIGGIFHQYDHMGVGGFSFRSKSLMERISDRVEYWDGTEKDADRVQLGLGSYEDGIIGIGQKEKMQSEGFKYATLQQGAKFCQTENKNYFEERPFGFHRGIHHINFGK